MKNIYFFTILSFFLQLSLNGQSGLNVYSGISIAKSSNILLTPEGTSHKGYHFGADGRLNSGNMYFMLGGQYHVVEYISQKNGDFFKIDNKMSWMKLRFGLGFNIININEKIALRTKALLALDFIASYPNALPAAPYQTYNSGTAGVTTGIGLDFFAFTFDIEYEKGFFNAVNMVKDTQFDFLIANLGVRF